MQTMMASDLKILLDGMDEDLDDIYIVLSSDDEGNNYRTISPMITRAKIEKDGYYIEPTFYEEVEDKEEINAIILG